MGSKEIRNWAVLVATNASGGESGRVPLPCPRLRGGLLLALRSLALHVKDDCGKLVLEDLGDSTYLAFPLGYPYVPHSV
jgi:hypothetical protein